MFSSSTAILRSIGLGEVAAGPFITPRTAVLVYMIHDAH